MHLVQQRIHAVSRRAQWLTRLYGFAWSAVIVLLALLLACLVDYAFRIQEHGIRWMLTAAFVGVAAWSVARFVLPAFRYAPSDVEVATRIERHSPGMEEYLSSAVEFLNQDAADHRAGSLELRRAVIREAENRLDQTDLAGCLNHRRTRDATLAAGAVGCLLVAILAVDLVTFRGGRGRFHETPPSLLALYRLATPWSNADWPRWNALRFAKGPTMLARGDDFEVEVVDARGHMPERVELQYRFEDDEPGRVQTKRMKPTAEGSVVHRLENVTRPFQYRAVGGDHDNMPWTSLRIVEPPRLVTQQVRLHPPAYSGRPSRESGPRIEALAGTRVEVQGEANKKLRAVRLRVPADASAAEVTASLSEDGRHFTIAADAGWQVRQSGPYWLELIDEEGLSGGRESGGEIRAVEDLPPTVSLEQPDANAYVTAAAQPLIRALAKDDLAVGRVELRYLRSADSESGEKALVIREAPPAETPAPSENGPAAENESRSQDDSPAPAPVQSPQDKVLVETRWDLSALEGLAAGEWIDFRVSASDYRPQWGHSTSRRLTIISPEQLEDRLAQQQAAILSRLAELLQAQRTARSQTRALEIQLDEAGSLEKRDVDQLQSAELNQRQIGRQLSQEADGIPAQITRLLDELEANRVDNPDLARRMTELRTRIASLGQQQVPQVQRQLVDALQSARERLEREPDPADDDPATRAAVQQAGAGQDEVIAALEGLLGNLRQWDNYRRFAREINRLQRDQEEIREQTQQLRLETLSKDPRDLTPRERADLKQLAERQNELARQFDKIQSRMREMREQLGTSDPLAAETLDDALETARELGISGQMRESGRQIEANRVGQAAQQQGQIAESIDQLLDVLANRREHELDRVLSQLKQSADALADLRRRQEDVAQRMGAAEQSGQTPEGRRQLDAASQRQQELVEQARGLARRLERLQAPRSSDATARAAQRQQQAAQAGQQGQAQDAREQAESAAEALREAEQNLQQRVQQAEQDLFEEQMARLEQALAGLIGRQQAVLDTTRDLDRLRREQDGQLDRPQLATLGDLSNQQRILAEETAIFAEKIARARAFQLGLEGAMREMARAARGLDRRDPGQETQRAETAALSRLGQMAEALRPPENPPEPPEPAPEDQPPPPNANTPNAANVLAELKLVKLMQEEINQRTAQLEAIREERGQWTAEQRREAGELASEQGQLATLILELLRQAREAQQDGANQNGANSDGANSDGANSDGANPDGANPDGASRDGGTGSGEEQKTSGDDPGDLEGLDRALEQQLLEGLKP